MTVKFYKILQLIGLTCRAGNNGTNKTFKVKYADICISIDVLRKNILQPQGQGVLHDQGIHFILTKRYRIYKTAYGGIEQNKLDF